MQALGRVNAYEKTVSLPTPVDSVPVKKCDGELLWNNRARMSVLLLRCKRLISGQPCCEINGRFRPGLEIGIQWGWTQEAWPVTGNLHILRSATSGKKSSRELAGWTLPIPIWVIPERKSVLFTYLFYKCPSNQVEQLETGKKQRLPNTLHYLLFKDKKKGNAHFTPPWDTFQISVPSLFSVHVFKAFSKLLVTPV